MTVSETRVMFGWWDESEVIAIFPDLKANMDGDPLCFQHIGQHGACDPDFVKGNARPATPEEYADMKRELEAPPYRYNLKVVPWR